MGNQALADTQPRVAGYLVTCSSHQARLGLVQSNKQSSTPNSEKFRRAALSLGDEGILAIFFSVPAYTVIDNCLHNTLSRQQIITTMLSRVARAVPRAAPLRSARVAAPFAARSVTTDAASTSLSTKVPEVREPN